MSQSRSTLGSLMACGLALATSLPGCVNADERPTPQPTPAQPSNVIPDRLSLSASWPEDTNANGYPDTTTVVVYVFDTRYSAAPIAVPGTMTLRLIEKSGAVVREWSYTVDETQKAVRRFAAGPGYQLLPSLLDHGTDRVDVQEVDVMAIFTPVGGTPVRSRGSATIRIGRLR